MSTAPELMQMIRQLIATPSVSCVNPAIDQSNLPVVELLANWLQPLGFAVEILPVAEGKANLLATLGNSIRPPAMVDWCWRGTPTPCPMMTTAGALIRLP